MPDPARRLGRELDGEIEPDGTRMRALLAAVVEGSDDGIFAKDLHGTILTWNRGAERIYGYTPHEIVGANVSILVPPEMEDDVPAIMARLRRGEAVEQYETRRMAKDGRRLHVALTISPIRSDEGQVVGASTIARDVTALRLAESRRSLLADLGDALASVLDAEEALHRLAEVVVGGLADYCVAYLLVEGESIRRVGLAHADPDRVDLVRELGESRPPALDDPVGAGAVIRTGEPALMKEIDAAQLEVAAAGDERYLAVLRELRPVSSMVLPLRARGRIVGAVALVATERSGMRYTEEDLAFVRELAARAALGVDNARLFSEAQAELRRRTSAETALRQRYEQLRAVYGMTEAVARAHAPDEVYQEAIRALRGAIGADRASILRFDGNGELRFVAWSGLSEGYRAAVEGHTPWSPDTVDPSPIVMPDVAAEEELEADLKETILAEGIRALGFIPLTFAGRLLGKFMVYYDEPRAIAPEELEVARTVASTIGFAIVRMEDEQRVLAAKEAAERANQSKSQFLGVMSHELRTPLNSVFGYSDLLLMETRGPLNDGQREYIERIKGSAGHQLRLVEEILAYARIEAGREDVRLVPTDLNRSVTDVVEFVRPQAEQKGIALRPELPDAPIRISTDPARLRQILLNLAGNAVKFTDEGEVGLRLFGDGSFVALEVRDTGPGIPDDQLERIWEPFTQGDGELSVGRRSGGTGLGLTIARRYAELLGGEISARSGPGQGSTFTLRLPRDEPEE